MAFVQAKASADPVSSSTTVSVTITAGGTGNHIMGIVVCQNSGKTLNSVKDNNGVTYTIQDNVNDVTNATDGWSFYKENISGAPTSIIATFGDANLARIQIVEWSGLQSSSSLDGHSGSTVSSGAGGVYTLNSVTTTADGDLIYAAASCDTTPSTTMTAGTGFTLRNAGTGSQNAYDETQVQGTHGAIAPTLNTPSTNQTAVGFVLAFKAAVAASFVPYDWWPQGGTATSRSWPRNLANRNAQQRDFQMFVLPKQPTTLSQTGIGFFSPFDPARKPKNYARDWVEYNEIGYKVTTLSQTGIAYFTPFWPKPPKPPNFARDWIEFYQQTTAAVTVITFGGFTPFDPPAKPVNFSRDWVAVSGNISVNAPQYTEPFSPFDPAKQPHNLARDFQYFINAPGNPNQFFGSGHDWWPRAPKPPFYAVDWITQFGNISVDTLPIDPIPFSPFDPAPRPHNYARDWIEYNEIGYTITTLSQTGIGFFTPFDPPAKPHNFAHDWIEYSEFGYQSVPYQPGIGFFTIFDPAPRPHNFAKDWIEYNEIGYQTTTRSQTGTPPFTPFGPAARPKNFAQDWIAFSGSLTIEAPQYAGPWLFSRFEPPLRPRNFSTDWIAFSGDFGVEFPVFSQPFTSFDPPARPHNFARDWVAFSGNYLVETPPAVVTFGGFSPFGPPPKPNNFASDWTAYHPSNQFFTPTPTTSTMFMSFSDGMRAKLWSKTGQQPQWWTYSFISPPSPPKPPSKRDTHDAMPKRRHRRVPVYSQEYYDLLRKEQLEKLGQKQLQLPLLIPNLLIPLDGLIPPVDIPSLIIDIPSLRTPVPERADNQATPGIPGPGAARDHGDAENVMRQFADDVDKLAEKALARISEIERNQPEFEAPQNKTAATVRAPATGVMQQFANAIDDLYKIGLSKNRVIYDTVGRIIGVEPIPEEEEND